MRILLSTLAFSNPNLLDRCISSWPRNVDHCVLWQGMDIQSDAINEVIKKQQNNRNIKYLIRRKNNWGFSGGCNILMRHAFIIHTYDALVITGSDTMFNDGFWNSFTKQTENFDFVESSHQFNCFYMNRFAWIKTGYFDENFFPSYVEDDDYRIRVIKSGIRYKQSNEDPNLLTHFGSATVKLNPMYQLKSRRSFELNKEYMHRKWGGIQNSIPKWKPEFDRPFNDTNWPLDRWILEPERRKKQLWHNIIEDDGDPRIMSLVHALECPETFSYHDSTY